MAVIFEDDKGYRHELIAQVDSDLGGVELFYYLDAELFTLWLDADNARALAQEIARLVENQP